MGKGSSQRVKWRPFGSVPASSWLPLLRSTGYSAWSASGDVAAEDLHVLVADSVRLRQNGSIARTLSTAGYESVRISGFLAARLLEGGDACVFEISTDGGSSFVPLLDLGDGDDDGEFRWSEQTSPAYANNPNLVLRFRNASNALSDHCYAEDVAVAGFPIGSPSCDPIGSGSSYPDYVVDFDPLAGAGVSGRTELTAATLNSGPAPGSPIASSAFGVAADAAAPLHQFEGRLELLAEATSGSFTELRDDFAYTGNGDDPRKHLPDFDFEFVQTGSHIVPVAAASCFPPTPTGSSSWNPGGSGPKRVTAVGVGSPCHSAYSSATPTASTTDS